MTRAHRRTPALAVFCLTMAVGCGGGSGTGAGGQGGSGNTGGTVGSGGSSGGAGAGGAMGVGGTTGGAAGVNGTTGATGGAGAAGTQGTAGAGGGAAGAGIAGMKGTAGAAGAGAAGASAAGAGGATSTAVCDDAALTWKTGSKTNFTSYPAPGSAECIQYSGCMYEGEFAGCDQTEPLAWVMSHNIVAAFPDFNALKLHDLCLKSSTGKTIVVTVLDTCGDSDCNGCCTQNKGTADELIDVESFTDMRWGVPDGRIQWADLGPTKTAGCK